MVHSSSKSSLARPFLLILLQCRLAKHKPVVLMSEGQGENRTNPVIKRCPLVLSHMLGTCDLYAVATILCNCVIA